MAFVHYNDFFALIMLCFSEVLSRISTKLSWKEVDVYNSW